MTKGMPHTPLPPVSGWTVRHALLSLVLASLAPAMADAAALQGTVRVSAQVKSNSVVQPYAGRASSLPSPARDSRGRVGDAVLSIRSLSASIDSLLPAPRERARLLQKDQSFQPRVLVVRQGDLVDFPNMDPIFHNVFSVSPAKRFDLGKYPRPQSRSVRFDKTGVVHVFCDIHADMAAYIVVLKNRAFARPDANGRYRLPDLPAGRYLVTWWHPDLAGGEREVTLTSSGDSELDVEF